MYVCILCSPQQAVVPPGGKSGSPLYVLAWPPPGTHRRLPAGPPRRAVRVRKTPGSLCRRIWKCLGSTCAGELPDLGTTLFHIHNHPFALAGQASVHCLQVPLLHQTDRDQHASRNSFCMPRTPLYFPDFSQSHRLANSLIKSTSVPAIVKLL